MNCPLCGRDITDADDCPYCEKVEIEHQDLMRDERAEPRS